MINLHHASCFDWLADYDGPLFDSCVTDPPYELGFMGKAWDSSGVAFKVETWRAVYDAMKPGAHLVAFSGTRTYHRMACAIEDAGFEIRDQLAWTYGSGFPKSHDISKAIDKNLGGVPEVVGYKKQGPRSMFDGGKPRPQTLPDTLPDTLPAKQWQGWGTALKPAWEPICLARKPISEKNIAANVLKHGTGAVNVDACRVGTKIGHQAGGLHKGSGTTVGSFTGETDFNQPAKARFPANIIHDGSDEVLAGFPDTGAGSSAAHLQRHESRSAVHFGEAGGQQKLGYDDNGGSAARFFYSAKAGPLDRIGTAHATVKPVDLMRWLCRLITPQDGHILEPFAGSGTTGIAAMAEGFDCTMIELEAEHVTDIQRKLDYLQGKGGLSAIEKHKARIDRQAEPDNGPLFAV